MQISSIRGSMRHDRRRNKAIHTRLLYANDMQISTTSWVFSRKGVEEWAFPTLNISISISISKTACCSFQLIHFSTVIFQFNTRSILIYNGDDYHPLNCLMSSKKGRASTGQLNIPKQNKNDYCIISATVWARLAWQYIAERLNDLNDRHRLRPYSAAKEKEECPRIHCRPTIEWPLALNLHARTES